ncbi:MAG TPA: hypothetical protein VNO79_03585 [Actinomycetota bacterium]|nr:hypothetical protein [Actinomycetota bacterium]
MSIGGEGYPTEQDLATVANWPAADPEGWFAFVRERWWAADWGWREYSGLDKWGRPVRVYALSTAGWSGNESLIDAMERNWMLWGKTWVLSRRGGHYEFHVPRFEPLTDG